MGMHEKRIGQQSIDIKYISTRFSNDMSWSECLLLGQELINAKAYNQTKAWIKESMKRYNDEAATTTTAYSLDYLEKLGETLMKTGDKEAAQEVFRSVVVKDPSRLKTVSNMFDNAEVFPENNETEREYYVS